MKNDTIDGGNAFDWGRSSEDYARFRDIYPPEFYRRILDLGLCTAGQDVLDLGTGTGVLPRALYAVGAKFTGADISARQIEEARRLAEKEEKHIDFVVSGAEDLSFPPESFDVITACQCFIYFDKSVVLPKFHRLLRTDGHFCVLWMAWLPQEDPIAAASEKLILQYNPTWTGAGYQRPVLTKPEWAAPYFSAKNLISYDITVPFTRQSWQGRIRACRGIGASSLPQEAIDAYETEHTRLLQSFPEEFEILHHVTLMDFVKA